MGTGSVPALRELLERRFPGAQPVVPGGTTEPVATGVPALDGMLPDGGLPRGRLTLWHPGGGATAMLRSACESAVARGERAAWVDGAGTVVGAFWPRGPLLLRPSGMVETLECAELLLRSAGFALVVVVVPGVEGGGGGRRSGGWGRGSGRGLAVARVERAGRRRPGRASLPSLPSLPSSPLSPDAALVRLQRVAREGGAALVVMAAKSPVAALRVESMIRPEDYRWRVGPFGEQAEVAGVRVRVRATSPGWSGRACFELPVTERDRRLALEPGMGDRRGMARTGRRERTRARAGKAE